MYNKNINNNGSYWYLAALIRAIETLFHILELKPRKRHEAETVMILITQRSSVSSHVGTGIGTLAVGSGVPVFGTRILCFHSSFLTFSGPSPEGLAHARLSVTVVNAQAEARRLEPRRSPFLAGHQPAGPQQCPGRMR